MSGIDQEIYFCEGLADVYNDDLENDDNDDDDFEADEHEGDTDGDSDLAEEEEGEDEGNCFSMTFFIRNILHLFISFIVDYFRRITSPRN